MAPGKENYNNLNEFFRDEYASLNGYVRSRIDDTADRDAEDIVQEVALRLFSRADDLSRINNIAGFVYRAIRNRIIDVMRSRKTRIDDPTGAETRWVEFEGLFSEDGEETFPEGLREKLREAITTLKPVYREVILAIDFEGYSYREVAELSGIAPGTLMSRRHRALSLLHKKLKSE